jgi:hypothetical protein
MTIKTEGSGGLGKFSCFLNIIFCSVFKVKHKETGKFFALKIIAKENFRENEFLAGRKLCGFFV